jgi:hypothetical protein
MLLSCFLGWAFNPSEWSSTSSAFSHLLLITLFLTTPSGLCVCPHLHRTFLTCVLYLPQCNALWGSRFMSPLFSWDLPSFCSQPEYKTCCSCQVWWLTSIILTMWEAEIGRIAVQGQPVQKACEIPSQPIAEYSGAYTLFFKCLLSTDSSHTSLKHSVWKTCVGEILN